MKLLFRVFATLFFAIISPLYVLYLFVSFLLSPVMYVLSGLGHLLRGHHGPKHSVKEC